MNYTLLKKIFHLWCEPIIEAAYAYFDVRFILILSFQSTYGPQKVDTKAKDNNPEECNWVYLAFTLDKTSFRSSIPDEILRK